MNGKYLMTTSVTYRRLFGKGDQLEGVDLDGVRVDETTATVTFTAAGEEGRQVSVSASGRKIISRGRLSKRVMPLDLTPKATIALLNLLGEETGNVQLRAEAMKLSRTGGSAE